jgi:putative endonuclease
MKTKRKTRKYWYVYLVMCADGSYYCGVTTDLYRRMNQHNGNRPGGAKYTRGRRPVRCVYYAVHSDHGAALRREAKIKALNHEQKAAYDVTKQGKDK